MAAKQILPSIHETAFNCPHCGALAKQFWHSTHADPLKSNEMPKIWTESDVKEFNFAGIEKEDQRNKIRKYLESAASGLPFLEKENVSRDWQIVNLNLSRCFNCEKISIWIYDELIWPAATEAPDPNPDLPTDARSDYEEAGTVLSSSPRSAAALLRQAVQRLCKHLGGTGKNIDADISSFVKNGLDPRVQKALDVVRVIGNNAVHPGQIDLKDDRPTAEKLFGLVNLIADIMITQPKHIDAMFDGLPEGARKAIEKRDSPKQIEDKTGKS